MRVMKTTALLAGSILLCLAVVIGGSQVVPSPAVPIVMIYHPDSSRPPLAVCFAPGTPPEYMAEWQRRIWERTPLDYNIGGRWTQTATNGSTGNQGDPVHLTYSFVPDGLNVDGDPSVLFQRMNEMFDSPEQWQGLFATIFSEWTRVSGLTYSPEPDDGAAFRNQSAGVLGVRGDVRIGSIPMDGESGVLAYDYFPDRGDMVLDSYENWASPGQNYIFLRNIVAHEHGHGWGLEHVCPANGTKLLEPYYSSGFDGPQHDDIRAAQRNYGDRYEHNETPATATPLGTLSADTTITPVSLTNGSDIDYYAITIPPGRSLSLRMLPIGFEYLDGRQNDDGSCSDGTLINSLDDQNLDLYLKNQAGTQTLASSTTHGVGEPESILRYTVPDQGGSYLVEVASSGGTVVQLYDLSCDIYYTADPYLTLSPVQFDSTTRGVPVVRTTTLINPANNAVSLTSISTTGPFTVTPNTPQTVPAHGQLELTLTYLAEQLNGQTGLLTINHSGPGAALSCALTGFSRESALEFRNGHSFDFGEVGLGAVDSLPVLVRAQGNVPIQIISVQLSAPFSINLATPVSLNPTQTLILRPRFAPTQLGPISGELVIFHTAPSSPDTIAVTGTGVVSAADDPRMIAVSFRLDQNFPNPFNPTTTISYELAHAGPVMLRVYDITGREVAELVNELQTSGQHTVDFAGTGLASGVYLYRLEAGAFVAQHKMLLLK
jgi:hypothetical protein